MTNGALTESTIMVLGGLISIIIIVGSIAGVWTQFKRMKKEADDEKKSEIEAARARQEKETKSEIALRLLTETVENMRQYLEKSLSEIKSEIAAQFAKNDHQNSEYDIRFAKLEASVKSAHKRMNEHLRYDHKQSDVHEEGSGDGI